MRLKIEDDSRVKESKNFQNLVAIINQNIQQKKTDPSPNIISNQGLLHLRIKEDSRKDFNILI